jgi:hypothetical protein
MKDAQFKQVSLLLQELCYGGEPAVFSGRSLQILIERYSILLSDNLEHPDPIIDHWRIHVKEFRAKLIEEALSRESVVFSKGEPIPLITEDIAIPSSMWCPPAPIYKYP